jgi:hypothetical protein
MQVHIITTVTYRAVFPDQGKSGWSEPVDCIRLTIKIGLAHLRIIRLAAEHSRGRLCHIGTTAEGDAA